MPVDRLPNPPRRLLPHAAAAVQNTVKGRQLTPASRAMSFSVRWLAAVSMLIGLSS